ncbi:hypothetical protein [Lysobacter capsici]|uniref:hypothetical protein n=1 Tax=Lysobacter capsici TaxID=435897 RepID=UPI0012FD6EAF|nr:hypothetical protein [Lysobacter capsici]
MYQAPAAATAAVRPNTAGAKDVSERTTTKRIWFTASGISRDGSIKHFAVSRKAGAIYIRDFSGKEHRCNLPTPSIAAVRRLIASLFNVRISGVVMQPA